jgi:hypothetical protein
MMAMYPGVGSLGPGSESQLNSMLLDLLRGATAVCITFDGASNMSLSMFCTLCVVDTEFQVAVSTQGIQTLSCGSSGYLTSAVSSVGPKFSRPTRTRPCVAFA